MDNTEMQMDRRLTNLRNSRRSTRSGASHLGSGGNVAVVLVVGHFGAND